MSHIACPHQPRHHPWDKPAFVMCTTGERVTFGALEAAANQGAHLLRAVGIRQGQHIAILMENRREFLEICFAADRVGVYYTTISTHLSEQEIAFILRDCDARLLIVSDRFAAMATALSKRHICEVFCVGAPRSDLADWGSAASTMPDTPVPDERQGLDMLYSSGTTGRPKGIK